MVPALTIVQWDLDKLRALFLDHGVIGASSMAAAEDLLGGCTLSLIVCIHENVFALRIVLLHGCLLGMHLAAASLKWLC